MKHTRTIAVIVWLFLAMSTSPIDPAEAAPARYAATAAATTEPAPVTTQVERLEPWRADYPAGAEIEGAVVYAGDERQVEDVRWALERFAVAGLALPAVEVWAHADPTGCRGSDGVERNGYLAHRNGSWVIFTCGSRFVLLHELAHVWDNHVLTEDVRKAFLAERGLDAWGGVAWSQAGGEHLANVIAWGIHDEHPRPNRTEPRDDASLTRAFAIATGGLQPLE